jgi:alpha-1,6-mannosyltransferase
MAWGVSDLARRVGTSQRTAAWLAVAAPLVGAHFVSGAHNDAVMVAAVVAGFALALRGLLVRAVLVVALGAMVKVTAVIALPFIALIWARRVAATRLGADDTDDPGEPWRAALRPREVLSGLALTGVAAAIPMALVSRASGLGFAWLNPADTAGRNEQWTSLPTGLGMAIGAVGHVLGRPEWRDSAISVARALALVVLAVILVLIWIGAAKPAGTVQRAEGAEGVTGVETERARAVRAAGWAFLAVILLAPVFLGWYFLWALPLLAATLGTGSLSDGLERWLPVAVTVLCFAQLPDGYSLGLTTTAIGVPLAVVAAVLLAWAGWRWARRVEWSGILDLNRPLTRTPVRNDGRVRERTSPSEPRSGFLGAGSDWATTATTVPRRRAGRGWLLVALPVLGLIAFAVWALTARVAEDDVAAHEAMTARIRDVAREFPPLGASYRAPCGITDEGWAELTWGPLTGPSVDDVETWLRAFGWRRGAQEGGTAVLHAFEGGRELTARVSPPIGDIGVRLTATSDANSLACLLH